MQSTPYLTTTEAAGYLRLKERKLYELVAAGLVPGTKVSGKWLFPRAALDRWLEAGLLRPQGFVAAPPPAIVGGSHDPLLEWCLRHSGSGLALLAEGSAAGLQRLARNEVAIAGIHFHTTSDDDASNIAALRAEPSLQDAVLLAFARREQGLLLARGNPLRISSLVSARQRSARFALRQAGAGAQQLLERLLAREGLDAADLKCLPGTFATGQDVALAIIGGSADCGLATRAVAAAHGLDFLSLAWESFDLALRRRTYFEAGPQRLLASMREPGFAERAAAFGGYDIAASGRIVFNA